ncbi:PREDICTED: probable protein phosphatase CG10417 isoform X3 [Papilio polytes]|uniref:probable protein phosphatase CG10417 isoform X3 n=1 Tax=Papilio polytes TaxID=76194 RepID=UPI0006769115|nr:PREDICTED: probable protein phosphatase CG10417 isoform X3 [Papilio polytes]
MGAYLSEPVTEKMSSDESNAKLECGASSMQGWRVNQEDAHNTILDYDAETSFFAVYDGHGGAEVATYCSQNLPEYIKKTDAYKNGDLVNALTDAFLGFDATIVTKEVMDILKELAGEINPPGTSDIEESEDENEVLAKYENKLTALHRARLGDSSTPLSPCLRAKKNTDESGASAASSSSSGHAAGSSLEQTCDATSSSKNGLTVDDKENADEDSGGVSSTNSNEVDKDLNGEVSTSEPDKVVKENDKPNLPAPDSSEDNQPDQPEQSEDVKSSTNGCNVVTTENCNGEVTGSKPMDGEDSNITSSNGSVTPVKSGKANDKSSPVSSSGKEAPERPKKSKIRRAAAAVYESILRQLPEDDDESDSNDETFEGGEICSSDDDNVNGVEESSNEECEEEEDEEDYEAESSDEEGDEDISMTEEPGNDSGCTAIVALLRGNELYVANAGDSRCIICREGKAIDMSIDHKPEDAPELDRIIKAGGKVSYDGRINGGLNLSRAIGDHSYKQNKELDAKEQMVTALPDVKTLTVDPAKDQFMVLACDGIWNFMSSQDVCDFIIPRLAEGRERLSQICEEMFDHCLAPSTMGDGTGCDNMTAIIVRFKEGLIAEVGQCAADCPKKRVADSEPCNETQQDNKRQKLDDTLSSSVVTSSV